MALGPIPCNWRTSASLSLVNCSSRTYPAPTSARRAGLANSVGRSLSCWSRRFILANIPFIFMYLAPLSHIACSHACLRYVRERGAVSAKEERFQCRGEHFVSWAVVLPFQGPILRIRQDGGKLL